MGSLCLDIKRWRIQWLNISGVKRSFEPSFMQVNHSWEWILQPLVKTQQLCRATDKAAMYAFICKLVFKKTKKRRSKRKKPHACHLSRYFKKECRALLCRHAWEVRSCRDWAEKDGAERYKSKGCQNPFLSLPPSQHISLFLLIFFSSPSSPPFFRSGMMADSSDPAGMGPWKWLTPTPLRVLAAFHSRSFRCL